MNSHKQSNEGGEPAPKYPWPNLENILRDAAMKSAGDFYDPERTEARIAYVRAALNSYESDQQKIAALVEALKMAQERIAELSQWANIPNEGQTNDEISAALASAQGGDK